MDKLIIASNNKGKIAEIKAVLGNMFDVRSLADENLQIDVEETGTTFEENALIKAKAVYELTGCACLSDDSGLIVDGLKGEPGVHSARYAGVQHCDEDNNALLLKNMKGMTDRKARFKSVVVLYISPTNITVAEGITEGEILLEKDGDEGFGYDPLFYSYDLNKSFGRANLSEKNTVSHRARALNNLMGMLKR